jgi:glucosyl-3-phosphoglycerate synthase
LDVEALLKLKNDLKVTISLVIPTLEEEDNIARTLSIVNEKVGRALLDEVVVIDGGSKDRTVELARAGGARVEFGQDILPQYASKGKGVQLWKSLQVTTGDVVLYCDADITNFSEIFILGLIGPLLAAPHYRYVKAFYKRMLRVNGDVQEGGGGRVTEILARPVFSLYYPELRHIIQPLGGEYGGWRKDLERVQYTSGYGVETKLLLQFSRTFGADAICQVNLHEKSHRHQTLAALSKMSFVIMQTFMRDMAERYDTPLMVERMNRTLWIQKQASSCGQKERSSEHEHCNSSGTLVEGDVGQFLQECHVDDVHLPAMIQMEEYQRTAYPKHRKVSILVCRHGQTHHHVDGKIMGWCNSTLTPEGQRQAQDLGRRLKTSGLKVNRVICSDLTRAIQTATSVITVSENESVKMVTDERLREKGKGSFENRTKDDILQDPDFRVWDYNMLTDPHAIPPGGEGTPQFRARLVNLLKALATEPENAPKEEGMTLLVTHHGVIWELYRFIFGVERGPDLAADDVEKAVGPLLSEAEIAGKIALWRIDLLVSSNHDKEETSTAGQPPAKKARHARGSTLSGMHMVRL